MAFAILAFIFVLLLTGLVVAVSMAVQARRQLEDLEEQLPDPHGLWVEPDSEPAAWSSLDFTDLHDGVTVDEGDPFETLGADARLEDRVASGSNASEWNPTPDATPREDIELPADLAPVASPRAVTWRATSEAPVSAPVVETGFVEETTTAGHQNTSQIVNDASAVPLDTDRDSATGHSSDGGPTGTDVAAADEPSEDPSWRHTSDRVQQLLDELKSPLALDGVGSNPPPSDPEPIAWRPPARATRPSIWTQAMPPSNGSSRKTELGDRRSNGSRRPRGSAGDSRR